jgi:hypothetical protein
MAASVSSNFGKRALALTLHLVLAASLAIVLDRWSLQVLQLAIGLSWLATTMITMRELGCPAWLVSGFASVCLQIPASVILATIAFILGLCRSHSAHRLAWMLALAIPLADIFNLVVPWDQVSLQAVLSIRFRLISLVGTAAVFLAWYVGYRIRGRRRCLGSFCRTCGYDLRGCSSPKCPECGTLLPAI